MSLQDVISTAQGKIGVITGIRAAPEYAPDQIATFPTSVAYPGKGYAITGPFGISEWYHDVTVELHFARKDLSRAIQAAVPYLEKIAEALTVDPWLDEYCETFGRFSYEFGPMLYDTTDTIGWRFTIERIKIYPYGKQ